MKRRKRAIVTYEKREFTVMIYTCPHCKTEIRIMYPMNNVTRVLCDHCKNEIILERNK